MTSLNKEIGVATLEIEETKSIYGGTTIRPGETQTIGDSDPDDGSNLIRHDVGVMHWGRDGTTG